MGINVYSEIGKLKTVLLHRPGKELENLTPEYLERLLFDDIPFLKVAQEEHDYFANALGENGVEVLYINEMTADAIKNHPEIKEEFINKFISEAEVHSKAVRNALFTYLLNLDDLEMINKMISGIRTHEISVSKKETIMDMLETDYPFYTDPIPNILFQRDPFASIGHGVSINKMFTVTRSRETLFSEYMFKYHPRFEQDNIPFYYNRNNRYNIEGGDILVLNEKTLAIGISKRTDPRAIEFLAHNIFFDEENSFETILAFNIPKTRAFMHLDTVFTQIDYDKFTIHPKIMDKLMIFELTKGINKVKVNKVVETLENILKKYLNRDITLINCGGNDDIVSGREQWNDGANTLCISPGVVIVYNRNTVTNEILQKEGIKVIEIPSSELSRGRGGPRCMSMALFREKI